ncbi:D-alanyl-D-alanine carboxypeptidase [Streptomyces sp. HNM0574]|uniref:D-alanyl-D-alanine carboxypeptidase family protein n=1 Tax=Streptomyces sp. HNM0574 TaxID=2714954 RepID=UPI00146CB3E5|nr:D-alanyl-D-alanine carboxypeptidase [Streptomyces sp. HNM0574]NLU66809.1 D-alanyl-D-alanine carboxypeptidase [Streptomyces sp. HNM0574]
MALYVRFVPTSSRASRASRASRLLPVPRRGAGVRTAAAAAGAAVLLVPVLGAAPAMAADPPDGKEEKKKAEPPARMSTVGGSQLGLPGTQVSPRKGAPELPKKLSARSWIVSDAESGEVLASHNAHWKLAPASTLKMLFADTVLPKFPKSAERKVTHEDLKDVGEGSSLVGVKEGQSYSVHDLWRGVFLRSGNDAVHVLAAMNGGVEKTVEEMNAQAEKLHADDTHVVSPDGYDQPGQVSSAYDLTLFARSGMQKKDFREYAATATAKFPGDFKKKKKGADEGGENGDDGKNSPKEREYFEIQNTNRLLTGDLDLDPYPGIAGVKNGTTTNAGSTFTGVAERDGRVLLVTVMHPEKDASLEVYKETAKLFDWGFEAADKVRPVGHLVEPGSAGEHAHSAGQAGGAGEPKEQKPRDADGGVGIAIGVTGGALVLLAVVGYGVHRRWPLPDLARSRRRTPRD